MINWILKLSPLVILPFMLQLAWSEHSEYSIFKSQGKAPLVEAWTKTGETRHRLERFPWTVTVSHNVDIQFTTPTGQEITVHKNISDDLWKAHQNGEALYLLYLPQNPQKTRFNLESDQSLTAVFLGISISAFLFFIGAWNPKKQE